METVGKGEGVLLNFAVQEEVRGVVVFVHGFMLWRPRVCRGGRVSCALSAAAYQSQCPCSERPA